ncbi:hypothetical protein N7488_008802 [Penicillium malachiteum]|nr:hypothetical protein N7488_008802 [Penicillium malachiteum]
MFEGKNDPPRSLPGDTAGCVRLSLSADVLTFFHGNLRDGMVGAISLAKPGAFQRRDFFLMLT